MLSVAILPRLPESGDRENARIVLINVHPLVAVLARSGLAQAGERPHVEDERSGWNIVAQIIQL